MRTASTGDYRELARRRLPRLLFEYLDGGAFAETTLARNTADLERIALRQRVLRDVSRLELGVELFGQAMAMPVILGPVGLAGLYARRGEAQAARAAEAAGLPFCLSGVSVCPLDEVAQAVDRPLWFQIYMLRDRGVVRELIARARDRGCAALVFTVDVPTAGLRYRDLRNSLVGGAGPGFHLHRAWQGLQRPAWMWDVALHGRPFSLGNVAQSLGGRRSFDDCFGWLGGQFAPEATWKDLDFVRREWSGPLIIKGVLDPDDARAAADVGAEGVVVSNHGGRQLDGVLSTARALPAIAEAVGDRITVLADGGVRSGLDVVRMLALGARGVLLGRAWAYALAGGGQRGVAHMLGLMAAEMRVALALTGVTRVADLDRSCLAED